MHSGALHIDHYTQAYFTAHLRLRILFTLAHASWLNQAELLLRAFSDKYLSMLVGQNTIVDLSSYGSLGGE